MEDLEFIKKFSKISVTRACQIVGVNRSNLYTGRLSKEQNRKVREFIEDSVARLYIKGENQNGK